MNSDTTNIEGLLEAGFTRAAAEAMLYTRNTLWATDWPDKVSVIERCMERLQVEGELTRRQAELIVGLVLARAG